MQQARQEKTATAAKEAATDRSKGEPSMMSRMLKGMGYAEQAEMLRPDAASQNAPTAPMPSKGAAKVPDPARAAVPTQAAEPGQVASSQNAEPQMDASAAKATEPAEAQQAEATEADVPAHLDQRSVAAYMRSRFKAEVQGAGNFEDFFSLDVHVKRVTKPPKNAAAEGLDSLWMRVASKLNGLNQDERDFKSAGFVQTTIPAKGRKPETTALLKISVGLTRRAVSEKENAAIGDTCLRLPSSVCHGGVEKLEPGTHAAFLNFFASIPAEFRAIDPDYGKVTSGFRSVAEQERAFARKLASVKKKDPGVGQEEAIKRARKWVAQPGTSAHNTGQAIDIWMGWSNSSGNATKMTEKKGGLYKKHGKFYEWCKENAPKHGFLPYSAEPWHWEHWKS